MPDEVDELVHGVRESTARFLLAMGELTGDELGRESLLPGWTVGHVLSHVSRNAEAIHRAVDGMVRGEPVPMYPGGTTGRDADIEAGARRPLEEQLADLRETAVRLDELWRGVPAGAWDSELASRQGPIPARRAPAMRWSEVELHWVDLGLDYSPASWPIGYTSTLLRATTGSALAGRLPAGTAVELRATDTGSEWSAGEGEAVVVRGPSWAIACWLAGRPAPARSALSTEGTGELPALAPWL